MKRKIWIEKVSTWGTVHTYLTGDCSQIRKMHGNPGDTDRYGQYYDPQADRISSDQLQ